ncbi:MAG: PKD domain-containing protein [Acidimicrobiales bacterium]
MLTKEKQYETPLGIGLIVIGVVLLAAVAFSAFSIIGDPGGNYDSWVPEEETTSPEASFDWESSGLSVDFTDTSEIGDSEIERWIWEFDDGTTSDDPNPTHRFGEEGEWQVTLDVVAEDGLTSKAEGAVEIERGSDNSGEGTIGLNDMADKVVVTVERAAKGSVVVVLVIGLFIVLAIVGGRLVSNGVRMLRPVPKRINVKLRPKELELAMLEAKPDIVEPKEIPPIVLTTNEDESTDVLEPV